MTGWWFQIFFIFIPKIGEDAPNLTSIFFKGVVQKTTNQMRLVHLGVFGKLICWFPAEQWTFWQLEESKSQTNKIAGGLQAPYLVPPKFGCCVCFFFCWVLGRGRGSQIWEHNKGFVLIAEMWYCWWVPEIREQLTSWGKGRKYPIIYKVLAPSKRWLALGFQPSTVGSKIRCLTFTLF